MLPVPCFTTEASADIPCWHEGQKLKPAEYSPLSPGFHIHGNRNLQTLLLLLSVHVTIAMSLPAFSLNLEGSVLAERHLAHASDNTCIVVDVKAHALLDGSALPKDSLRQLSAANGEKRFLLVLDVSQSMYSHLETLKRSVRRIAEFAPSWICIVEFSERMSDTGPHKHARVAVPWTDLRTQEGRDFVLAYAHAMKVYNRTGLADGIGLAMDQLAVVPEDEPVAIFVYTDGQANLGPCGRACIDAIQSHAQWEHPGIQWTFASLGKGAGITEMRGLHTALEGSRFFHAETMIELMKHLGIALGDILGRTTHGGVTVTIEPVNPADITLMTKGVTPLPSLPGASSVSVRLPDLSHGASRTVVFSSMHSKLPAALTVTAAATDAFSRTPVVTTLGVLAFAVCEGDAKEDDPHPEVAILRGMVEFASVIEDDNVDEDAIKTLSGLQARLSKPAFARALASRAPSLHRDITTTVSQPPRGRKRGRSAFGPVSDIAMTPTRSAGAVTQMFSQYAAQSSVGPSLAEEEGSMNVTE